MSKYPIRVWAEQTLFDCQDYEIWCPIPPYPTMPPRLLFAAKQPPCDDNGSKGS